jgi:hypothetical protein
MEVNWGSSSSQNFEWKINKSLEKTNQMGLSEKKGPQNPVLHRHHSPHENSHG